MAAGCWLLNSAEHRRVNLSERQGNTFGRISKSCRHPAGPSAAYSSRVFFVKSFGLSEDEAEEVVRQVGTAP